MRNKYVKVHRLYADFDNLIQAKIVGELGDPELGTTSWLVKFYITKITVSCRGVFSKIKSRDDGYYTILRSVPKSAIL